MYHLLQRKLKKYYVKHPGKAERMMNDVTLNSEPVRNSRVVTRDKENKNSSKKRGECAVATVNVCDFSDKKQTPPNESESKNLAVPAGREQLSPPSQENLSKLDQELTENANSLQDDHISAKLVRETDEDGSGEQKDRTCSILSDGGIEISRKTSFNYSSVEVMPVNGRRLSLNLSHISVESKATTDKESSTMNLDEKKERDGKETAVTKSEDSPRRISETKSVAPQERNSPRPSGPNAPSIGKVSLINAKIVSIPLQQMKLDSPEKVIKGFISFSSRNSGVSVFYFHKH